MSTPKKCRGAQDCSGVVFCKNLCQSHYMREWYATGSKSGIRWCQKPATEGFQGICGKKVHRSNLCNVHWRSAPLCTREGCPRRVLSLGDHCPKHIPNRNGTSLCVIKNCRRSVIARRLCRKHYDGIKWEKRRRDRAIRRQSKNTIPKQEMQIYAKTYFSSSSSSSRLTGKNRDDAEAREEIACLRYVFETTDRMAALNRHHRRHHHSQGNT